MDASSVAVVVPVFGGSQHILKLLEALAAQTRVPESVVFVISESPEAKIIEGVINDYAGLTMKAVIVERSYPGKARNVGVFLSKEDWIAFLDLRTIPDTKWLETVLNEALESGLGFIGAIRSSNADTHFKKVLRAATHGRVNSKCLSGSIIKRKLFVDNDLFKEDMRAGEDWEWLDRMTARYKHKWLSAILVDYQGFPDSLVETLQKWFIYSVENAKASVFVRQKVLYFVSFLIFLFSVYSWNFVFTGGVWDDSPFFIPHLNKIVWVLLFSIYFLYRGIVRPLSLEEPKEFLFPLNWIFIGSLGIALDLAKSPGRILGFIRYISK